MSFHLTVKRLYCLSRRKLRGEAVNPAYSEETMKAYSGADTAKMTLAAFEKMSGVKIPDLPPKYPVTIESRFTDMNQTFMGRILFNAVLGVAKKQAKKAEKLPEGAERDNKIKGALFLKRILESNSIRSMSMSASKSFPYNFAQGFAELTNGHLFRGAKCFMKPIKVPPLPKHEK